MELGPLSRSVEFQVLRIPDLLELFVFYPLTPPVSSRLVLAANLSPVSAWIGNVLGHGGKFEPFPSRFFVAFLGTRNFSLPQGMTATSTTKNPPNFGMLLSQNPNISSFGGLAFLALQKSIYL